MMPRTDLKEQEMGKIIAILRVILLIQELSKKPDEAINAAIMENLPGSDEEKEVVGELIQQVEPNFLENLFNAIGSIFGRK